MKLRIEGHSVRAGYVISRTWTDEENIALSAQVLAGLVDRSVMNDVAPVRCIQSRDKAFAFVERYNRRFATH